jgi:hypothetical protein
MKNEIKIGRCAFLKIIVFIPIDIILGKVYQKRKKAPLAQ